jgi:propanol-preferring alcohol dehydrogenase
MRGIHPISTHITPVKTEIHTYPLLEVNQALDDLRNGRFSGAGVILLSQ